MGQRNLDSEVPVIVVTGFGPFGNNIVNSSWVTVQELLKINANDMRIIAREIPVDYEIVAKVVPELWEMHKPQLVVHCGMSEKARCLTIEKFANNKFYYRPDIRSKLPLNSLCCQNGPDLLCTNVDVPKLVDDVNGVCLKVGAEASEDAGKYLCEFIYYSSLNINKNTVFVHVPPIDLHHSAQEMANSLLAIIREILKQCVETA